MLRVKEGRSVRQDCRELLEIEAQEGLGVKRVCRGYQDYQAFKDHRESGEGEDEEDPRERREILGLLEC